jgi:peptide/nickel transport system ATP-binding protein
VGVVSQVLDSMPADQGGKPILEIRDLCVTFRKKHGFVRQKTSFINAVFHASFSVGESELFSIVGESGSGKTTIARCLLAIARPTSGAVYWKGKNLGALRGDSLKEFRRNVQIVYQDPYESLNPRKDVFETIAQPIRDLVGVLDASLLDKKVADLLRDVGLDPEVCMHRLPHQLSGGERQRVNIARALAPGPKILVADEPTTMLDASQRITILSLLRKIKAEHNLTVVLITHDLAVARLMGSRIAVMFLGRLVEVGPAKEVVSRPHHPYSELVMEAIPDLEGTEVDINDFLVTIEESETVTKGCVFRPRCKYATDTCAEAEPELLEKSREHSVACYNPLNTPPKHRVTN